MPTATIRPAEQQTFAAIAEGESAYSAFRQFLIQFQIDNKISKSFETISKDLGFLLDFFDWIQKAEVQLSKKEQLDSMEFAGAISCSLKTVVSNVQFIPLCDCEPHPAWMNRRALEGDFFKLLSQSADLRRRLPEILKRSRPSKWGNTEKLDRDLHAAIGIRLAGCVYNSFRETGMKSHWRRYTRSLLLDNPFILIRECLLAYCVDDFYRFSCLQLLCEFSSSGLVLAPSLNDEKTWLVLVSADSEVK